MIHRTFDGTFLTEVANHPDVRPWLGPPAKIDMRPEVSDPANVALQGEHGGFVFLNRGRGLYELHYHFRPEGWGSEPRAELPNALAYVFDNTDCIEVLVAVSTDNPRSEKLIVRAGFERRQTLPSVWPTPAGLIDMTAFSLSRAQWLAAPQNHEG